MLTSKWKSYFPPLEKSQSVCFVQIQGAKSAVSKESVVVREGWAFPAHLTGVPLESYVTTLYLRGME